jgi:hypothetical protein
MPIVPTMFFRSPCCSTPLPPIHTRKRPKTNPVVAWENALAKEIALGRNHRKIDLLKTRIGRSKGNGGSDYDLTKVFGGGTTKQINKSFIPTRKIDERLVQISEKKIRDTYIALAKWMIGVNDPEINGFPSEKGLLHKKQYFKTVNTERRKSGKNALSMDEFMTESRREAKSISEARLANLRKDKLASQAARDRLTARHLPSSNHTTNSTNDFASGKPTIPFIESGSKRKIRNAYINLAQWMIRINDLAINGRPSQIGITHKVTYLSFVNKERSKLDQRQLTMEEFMSGVRSEIEDLVDAGTIKKIQNPRNLAQHFPTHSIGHNSLPGRPIPLLVVSR